VQAERAASAARERAVRAEADAQLADAAEALAAAQRELAGVADFRERQREVESELLRVKEDANGLRERLDAQKAELERCVRASNAMVGAPLLAND
jgi:hypothetical protein